MDIILFSTADWDNPFWTNKQHMAKTFEANGHRVIYIDSLGLRKPTATTKDLKRICKKLKSLVNPYKQVSQTIWRVSPFILPFHNSQLAQKFNKWFLFFTIQLLAKKLKFKDVMVWTYSPATDDIVDLFQNKQLLVYHCVDDLRASPGINAQMIERRETSLAQKANIVFTTSQTLLQRLKPYNQQTYYLNNVCDYHHFSGAQMEYFVEPEEYKMITHPRILLIGALSQYKVDFELIASIAQQKPQWSWVLIGEIGEGEPETNIALLKACKNVYLLGPKDYKTLPQYLQHCDVTVIPARINQYTDSMFPMKFFEYLAAGKQVVTTDLKTLHEYSHIYFNSKNHEEFLQNLSDIIINGSSKNKQEILKVCLDQTWQKRYEVMINLIKQHMKICL